MTPGDREVYCFGHMELVEKVTRALTLLEEGAKRQDRMDANITGLYSLLRKDQIATGDARVKAAEKLASVHLAEREEDGRLDKQIGILSTKLGTILLCVTMGISLIGLVIELVRWVRP